MLLSKRWLSDYVNIDKSDREYARDMTMSGSKVEGYKKEGEILENIVVGKVLEIKKHPNADSLFICIIDIGADTPVQIITAATNVLEGAFLPVSLDGATLADGKKIKKGKLRGEESQGMLCSLDELGLSINDFPYADKDGIFLIDEPNLKLGQDIREALGFDDTIVEFEITNNRPDCLSVLGLARESAATYDIPFTLNIPDVKPDKTDNITNYLSVELENPRLCLRYAAAAVKNVKIQSSPRWLRERLRASGVRPINNIVDITNFVMLEYGQPMHAFDLRHVNQSKIVVRNAMPGETITTLDGTLRTLSEEMLVIADGHSATAVAGVMGGQHSGIYHDTQTIIFESACFDGPNVRATSKKLGLRSESSSRFEKGLDPENCLPALMRACQLVQMLEAGVVVEGILDIYSNAIDPTTIKLDHSWINRLLGINISQDEMIKILLKLGFGFDGDTIIVPSFRADVTSPADIAEEIARIYGYNNIPTTALKGMSQGKLDERQHCIRNISSVLLSQGLSEIYTYSFISPRYYDKICLEKSSPLRNSVTILNPLGEDTSVMRTTALHSMLEALSRNYSNRLSSAWLYEVATIYLPNNIDQLPDERKQIILGFYGEQADYYLAKGAVEIVLKRCGITDWSVEADGENLTFHPGRTAKLFIAGKEAGVIGEIHPSVCNNYEINETVTIAYIDFEVLFEHANADRTFKHLPRFPASVRDLALVCDEGMTVATIEKAVSGSIKGILEEIKLFDVYRGKQVEEGKKSIAYSLTLRAADRTLTDKECDNAVAKALKALAEIGVVLRS